MAASRWVVQQVTAAAGKDVAAYFNGNQDRRNVYKRTFGMIVQISVGAIWTFGETIDFD